MSRADEVIGFAEAEVGKPYVFGDEGPDAFDCSGLMQWIFAKVGVVLPRVASDQQAWATRVTNPAPGDMVFWGDPAYHVALYIGNGRIVTAPQPGATVRVEDIGNNTPTSYGRVPGLGSALAPIAGLASSLTNPITAKVSTWLTGGRHILLEAAFVTAGVVLVGLGLYRAVKPNLGGTR